MGVFSGQDRPLQPRARGVGQTARRAAEEKHRGRPAAGRAPRAVEGPVSARAAPVVSAAPPPATEAPRLAARPARETAATAAAAVRADRLPTRRVELAQPSATAAA